MVLPGGTELLTSHELYQVCLTSLTDCKTKKSVFSFMMSHMVGWLIPNHFYLQCSEWVSMTISCHSQCYTQIFCLLKIITEQIICSALYSKKSTHINGWTNRFHFQIKQKADRRESGGKKNENSDTHCLGPPDFWVVVRVSFIRHAIVLLPITICTHFPRRPSQLSH